MSKVTLNIRKKVFELLATDERTRDSDMLLIARVWDTESSEKGFRNPTHILLLHELSFGNTYSNPESIRRCRQLIQKQNPELRGKNYELRHKKAQKMKEELMPGLKTL